MLIAQCNGCRIMPPSAFSVAPCEPRFAILSLWRLSGELLSLLLLQSWESCCMKWWLVAGRISCICCYDNEAEAPFWRRCSAVRPVWGGEGGEDQPWWITVFFSIPLSTTASRVSCLQPITELAVFINVLSLLASLAPMLLPQQTTAKKSTLATTDW